MTLATLVLLVVLSVAAVPLWWRRRPGQALVRDLWALGVLVLLAAAGVTAAASSPPVSRWEAAALMSAAVLAAVAGGGPVTEAVLRRAARGPSPALDPDDEASQVLRGGAWIGALERAGVCAAVIAASPEAIAVVLAVKGLGRYPELRHAGASERFIIGTLASLLWASGAAGVAVLAV